VGKQRKPKGLDVYLDKDIFSDNNTVIDAAADKLSEWQATTL
jgi:hypothetical protein